MKQCRLFLGGPSSRKIHTTRSSGPQNPYAESVRAFAVCIGLMGLGRRAASQHRNSGNTRSQEVWEPPTAGFFVNST